jgi:hypothetical protein
VHRCGSVTTISRSSLECHGDRVDIKEDELRTDLGDRSVVPPLSPMDSATESAVLPPRMDVTTELTALLLMLATTESVGRAANHCNGWLPSLPLSMLCR